VIQFYADKFINGDFNQAKSIIESKKEFIPEKDLSMLYM
jgi:hypothetical protein